MNHTIAEMPAAVRAQLKSAHIASACPRIAILKASGAGLLEYLQGQITQDIRKLKARHGIYTCMLTPQGKTVADMHIIQSEADSVLMLVERSHATALVGRLRQYMLGYELRIGIVEELAVISVQGPETDTGLAHAGLPVPEQESLASACLPGTETYAMRIPEAAGQGVWLILPQCDMEDCLVRLGNTVGEEALEVARILHGQPRFGVDWDEHIYPLNANLIEQQGVSFDKGCYVGQEVTSRMHWRKAIKWRLYRVQLSSAPAAIPCPVLTSARVGTLTSLARNTEGELFGIAHLRIQAAESANSLQLENGTAVSLID